MDILLALFDSTLGRARSCLDWRKVVVLRVLSVACFHIVRLFINLAAAPTVFGNFPEVARSLVPIGLLGMLVSVKANQIGETSTVKAAHGQWLLRGELKTIRRAPVEDPIGSIRAQGAAGFAWLLGRPGAFRCRGRDCRPKRT